MSSFWLLVSGFCLLVSWFWILVSGFLSPVYGVWFLGPEILSSGFCCLASGFWFLSPEAGGTGWDIPGGSGGGCSGPLLFKMTSKNPLGKPS